MEHYFDLTFKIIVFLSKDSVSVHNPSFYAKRFISFMGEKVFRRGPSAGNRASARRRSHRNRTTTNDSLGDAGNIESFDPFFDCSDAI